MRRRFSSSERAALLVAANGRCELCDDDLAAGWHADHVDAFSRGGATDVVNGQALCPSCNLKKGSGIVDEFKLRTWQQAFLRICDRDDFLLVACPGAGKTTAALQSVRSWWQAGARVIIVVPTDHLKQQWSIASREIGLEVSTMFENRNGVMPSDMAGISVTYHQVASEPLVFRRLSTQRRTMIVLDEVHHCGDEQSWGQAVREAFGVADRRLCLSGTPFRGDNSRIPFITYKEGVSLADFSYGYGQALLDGVCRDIQFPSFEGSMSWVSRGQQYDATFADQLPKDEISRRLNTALTAKSDWMRQLMTSAHASLMSYRADHPDAAGLILAKDTDHAEALADVMASVADRRPVVVTSAHDDATKRIERFRESRDPWVVAVQMISEGVDIPRLRVLVYATNTKAELFFRQAIGRVSRSTKRDRDDGGGFADCFIPADPDLCMLANKIQEERNHALEEEEVSIRREMADGDTDRQSSFLPLGAIDAELSKVHSGGDEFSRDEITRAEDLRVRTGFGANVSAVMVARLLRAAGHPAPAHRPAPIAVDLVDDRQKLRGDLSKLVKRWAYKDLASKGSSKRFDKVYGQRAAREPHGHFVPVAEATIAELKAAKAWVIVQMDSIR